MSGAGFFQDEPEEPGALALHVGAEEHGQRLDKALSQMQSALSRSRLQSLIEDGAVRVGGVVVTNTSRKVKLGEQIEIDVPAAVSARPEPENIALDIVFEDADLIVLNKPAGLVVHPGAGHARGTLVNALLYHCAGSLSGIGGVMRPGIVHRLDKDTSGLMLVAKSDRAHQSLAAQLEDRSLSRVYETLVLKVPMPRKGVVDLPIGRDARQRLKMAIKGQGARAARTHYHVISPFGEALALVECTLETGRTHQIRVHMAALGHPVIGDPLYGPQPTAVGAALKKSGYAPESLEACRAFKRQALHARDIAFIHPVTDEEMAFTSSLPDDFSNLLKSLRK
jgi:23S rRNA pseudouridine1911/1915/1917 synthase